MVNPSPQDEALASYSVSGEAPRSILKFKTIIGNLDVSTKVPRHPGLTRGEHQGSVHLMLDSIPAEEWAKDYKEILERTVAYFNEAAEKNGKPIRMTLDPSVAKYEIVFVVDTIDTGNSGAAVFVRHAGCAIGTGII